MTARFHGWVDRTLTAAAAVIVGAIAGVAVAQHAPRNPPRGQLDAQVVADIRDRVEAAGYQLRYAKVTSIEDDVAYFTVDVPGSTPGRVPARAQVAYGWHVRGAMEPLGRPAQGP